MALLSRSKVALTKREPSAKPSVSSVLEMQVCQRGVQDCGSEMRIHETLSPLPCSPAFTQPGSASSSEGRHAAAEAPLQKIIPGFLLKHPGLSIPRASEGQMSCFQAEGRGVSSQGPPLPSWCHRVSPAASPGLSQSAGPGWRLSSAPGSRSGSCSGCCGGREMLQLTMVYDFKTLMSPKCAPALGATARDMKEPHLLLVSLMRSETCWR